MPEIKIEDQKKIFKTWTLPGNSLSQDEFLEGIQKAEEGPFMTFEEHHAKMDKWINGYKKTLGSCLFRKSCPL